VASKFVTTLSEYKWDLIPESQLHAAKKALTKSAHLMKVAASNPESVKDSLIQSAILGLDLTEGKKQGWLLPRKNQFGKVVIHLQVGYKGVEAIHQRMGVIDRLVIRVIRENDDFEWSGDDQEKPQHKADWLVNEKTRGEITGAYAITYYPDKSINITVSSIFHIYEKHRNRSESYKSYKAKKDKGEFAYEPPWVSDEQSMVEKTMAYIAAKQWPANIRDQERSSKIISTLNEIDISDYSYGYNDNHKKAFYELINNNDVLGLHLFSKRVGIEIYSCITKDHVKKIPRGGKMKESQKLNDLNNKGYHTLHQLIEKIRCEDDLAVKEIVTECQDVTKKLIPSFVSHEDNDKLNELLSIGIEV
jgi:phage RecT family recombinase